MFLSHEITDLTDEQEVLAKAQKFAGLTLDEVAARLNWAVPKNLYHARGWVGNLLETALGAKASTRPIPDFPQLGIEIKTLPLKQNSQPKESTFVCTLPLGDLNTLWEQSRVYYKLNRVLWIPVEAENYIPISKRRIGMPLLWSPTLKQQEILKSDWEELIEMASLGKLSEITSHQGVYLQIRPTANNRASYKKMSEDGNYISACYKGFYLRCIFTRAILSSYYMY
ncbi:DNA mismatch repair endonuclease MutH [Candidatus Nitrosacidococcus tergens]|uniref:DNA mismatch repair protein MutH n=1 Tax=Candidatus Nitrosacidococcus tergens TaxID=553981 RepID=A0A7G1Q7P5_9GAMM|nr:DNA mismatch repair endonuclease MutH [Candidatus Nitrosacidococcus tergens]CAB1274478.1 DNA mismatch repair protein MutH [Candidatus Nitrosacidococcus tergens]